MEKNWGAVVRGHNGVGSTVYRSTRVRIVETAGRKKPPAVNEASGRRIAHEVVKEKI